MTIATFLITFALGFPLTVAVVWGLLKLAEERGE